MDHMTQLIMLSPVCGKVMQPPALHKMTKQWSDLRNTLVGLGNDVIVIPKSDSVKCTAISKAGLFSNGSFIPSRFTEIGEEGEDFFLKWIIKHDFHPVLCEEMVKFGGAADAIFNNARDMVWLGIGPSDYPFKAALDGFFGADNVKSVQIIDSRFKSLESCFCPLGSNDLIWYPAAFDIYSQELISSWYPSAIAISEIDALGMACTAITSNHTIVTPFISYSLVEALQNLNYMVQQVDLGEFIIHGLGCKSLVLDLNE